MQLPETVFVARCELFLKLLVYGRGDVQHGVGRDEKIEVTMGVDFVFYQQTWVEEGSGSDFSKIVSGFEV